MTDAIKIGEVIDEILRGNVTEVSDRIWPLVAPWTRAEDVVCPFLIYTKTSVSAQSLDKDGWNSDGVEFQVDVISSKYNESAAIANKVRGLFENHHIMSHGLDIYNIRMTNINEEFNSNKYIQTLSFSCNIENL